VERISVQTSCSGFFVHGAVLIQFWKVFFVLISQLESKVELKFLPHLWIYRYLADKIAAHGHYVAIPDLMHSDFYQATDPSDEFAGLPIYLPKHPIPEARVEAARVLEQLQAKGFKKIGVLGNCWGAKIIISLLFGDKGVDAGVMQHPSFLTKEEIAAVKIPLAILGASIDVITPPAMAEEFGEILKASPEVGDKYYVKVFPDVEHGFTTRYDLKDEAAHLKACEAHDEMLAWFAKYLA
jgi:dienelactone hydrolase